MKTGNSARNHTIMQRMHVGRSAVKALRRTGRVAVSIAFGGALLGACACSRVVEPGAAADATHAAAPLRIGIADEPDSLNPFYSHTSVADDIAALLFAPLFRYDAHGECIPELATRVPTPANGDISADGRRIVLRLRPHLRWSDGAPLTSRDIAFTAKAVMNAHNSVKLRAGWSNITTIETPDAQTAIVHLRAPDAAVLGLFAGGGDAAYPPLPEHILARETSIDHADFNAHPISSGPWILRRWDHGGVMNFSANANYWGPAPSLPELRVVFLPDRQTLVTALLAHEIDATANIPVERLPEIRKAPGFRILSHDVAAYRHLDFNCRDAMLSDVRVRRALVEAVQWPALMQLAYGEKMTPAASDIFPQSWAAPHIAPYAYSPEHAARLLDAAGWRRAQNGIRSRNGRDLQLTIISGTGNPAGARAEVLLTAALAKIGVRLQTKNMPASYLFASNGPLYSGTYQLAWMSDTRAPDPDNAATWTSSAMPPNGANTVFLHDRRVDALAAAGRAAYDRFERKKMYQAEWERLHELVPTHIVAWQRENFVHRDEFTGFSPAAFFSSFYNSREWRRR